jgi:hypothetical protein
LDSIHKTSAKRLFEIIDFQRNRKKEEKFNYNEIAWAIPLNSQRKNRILINEYLVHLKDVGVIKNFIPDSPKGFFQVFFIDEVLREDFLKEMPLKAILPKTTQIELFGSKPKKRVFSEEEQILLDKYVAIKNDQGKIENIPGYRYKIEENISSDESILDSIRQFVEAHEKAELVKKEKAQILTEKEKQVEQEKQNFEEQKKEHDELLQRMNSLPEKELMAIQTAAIEKLKREFPDLDLEDEKGFNQKLISAEMLEIYKNLVMAM